MDVFYELLAIEILVKPSCEQTPLPVYYLKKKIKNKATKANFASKTDLRLMSQCIKHILTVPCGLYPLEDFDYLTLFVNKEG